jgi:multicomponent Na+:H+ antiporter subunit F
MTIAVLVGAALLAVAGVLLLVRLAKGPTLLDRVVVLDAYASILICALALEAALNRHLDTLPVLVVLSLLAFVGSVAVAVATRGRELDESEPS